MSAHTVFIVDETFGAMTGPSRFALPLPAAEVSVADLITERVRYEVESYNRKVVDTPFRGLVTPTHREAALNGPRGRAKAVVDVDAQVEAALQGFAAQNFLLLVDDVQVEALTERVSVRADMDVTFLKLVPLVGG